MLLRDATGKIIIIYRKDCKDEKSYNQKIYNIMSKYPIKYNNSIIIPPKLTNKIKNICIINNDNGSSSDSD